MADGIICLSDDTFEVIKDIYNISDNLYIVKHGYRNRVEYPISKRLKQTIRTKLNIAANEKILIYTGRLSKAKGTEILIQAFCRIANQNPNARLVLAGSAFEKEYYESLFSISKRAATKISFIGQVSHLEIKDWYTIADIGVFPSYTEQCSFTGIEMMMYGFPIIASDGFGVKNMFTDDENARIAKIGKTEEEYKANLAKAMDELLNYEAKCEILGKNARRTFEMKYNINNMIIEYDKLLNSIT